jgi:hypothetical protein
MDVFNLVEGDVTLTDSNGEPLATVSGESGSSLSTVVSGTVNVREQNIDNEGYIRNSSHNMGQYGGQWFPFALDDQHRLRVAMETSVEPHTLSGSNHTGVLSDSQIPSYITRDSELSVVSGVLQSNIDDKSDLGHTHDDRYYTESEIDAIITTISGQLDDHNELNNLDYDSSGHTGFASTVMLTSASGVLQDQIDDKSDLGHTHDDRYYTESEIDAIITTISGQLDDHNELNNLDYDSSGHTGFASTVMLTSASGVLQDQIDDKPETFIELSDTPSTYSGSIGQHLVSTGSTVEWQDSYADGFRDVLYLTYDGLSGTSSGEKGATLSVSGTWTITQLDSMYYVDSAGGVLTIIIPDADADNEGHTLSFRKPRITIDVSGINIQTVSGQNIGSSTVFSLCKPSNYVTIVSNNFGSSGSPDRRWRQIDDRISLGNYTTVNPAGGAEFRDLQEAIDVSGDGYTVEVGPGTYSGNYVVANKDLRFVGAGVNNSIITATSGTTMTVSGSCTVYFDEVAIKMVTSSPDSYVLGILDSATASINNGYLLKQASNTYGGAVRISSGGAFRSGEGAIQYFHSGTGGGDHIVFDVEEGDVICRNTIFTISTSASVSDYFYLTLNNDTDNSFTFYKNYVIMRAINPGFAGVMACLRHNATPSGEHMDSLHNLIIITGPGSSGNGICYCSSDSTTIRSSHNRVEVTGFANNYFCNTWTSGTVISHFDYITAVDGAIGDGTYSYVNSPSNGDIEFSGSLKGLFNKKITVAESGGDYTNIQEAVDYISTVSSGTTDKYAVEIQPGFYTLSGTLNLNSPNLAALIGINKDTVKIIPNSTFADEIATGAKFMHVPYRVALASFVIDATDYPTLKTASSGVGICIQDTSYEEIALNDVGIKGFRYGLCTDVESNIYAQSVDVRECGTGVYINGDYCLFDADNLYIEECWDKHLHVANGEVYIGESEFNSTTTNSGTAVYVEGDNTVVELFAGTNIWGATKNLYIKDDASLRVDNCVLESTVINPGIEQKDTSTLIIVNSRAPLSDDDVDIDDPTNVYINAYDSTRGRTTLGSLQDVDVNLFSVNIGSATNPVLRYDSSYYGYKGIIYNNPTDGQETILGVESTNEDSKLRANVVGNSAWSHGAYVSLYSDQSGSLRGWDFGKNTGSTPSFTFKYLDSTLALQLNANGTVQLNTGVSVNKVLDEDGLNSNDSYALATQQSIKAYIDNNTYSTTALDSGQLDNRYYTETEIDTLSGTLNDKFIHRDGTTELTADWDAGDNTITAGGFKKGSARVDYANFANSTGLLTGGDLSVYGGDNTLLTVASGTSLYVDMSDPSDPVVEVISWPAQNFDPTLSGIRKKYIGVYRTGEGSGGLVADTEFSALEKRTIAVLGVCWGFGEAEIANAKNYSVTTFNYDKTLEDLSYALGSINIYGNKYTGGDEALKVSKSEGRAFRFAGNYENSNVSPNIISSSAQSDISSYQYHLQDSDTTTTMSGIDVNYYDLNGVKSAVPSGKWTVQRLYFFPGGNNTHVTYGQEIYDSPTLAYDGINIEDVSLNTSILDGSVLRSYVIVQEGSTSLSGAVFVDAYTDEGLVPGYTNHGDLGGLANDDHPQYLTTARGDSRYYSQSHIDTLSGTLSNSYNINHSLAGFYPTNVGQVLEWLNSSFGDIGYSGRTSPASVLTVSGSDILVNSGRGYITDGVTINTRVAWDATTLSGAGNYSQGNWYVYSDTSGDIQVTNTFPSNYNILLLGFFYSYGSGVLASVIDSPSYIASAGNRTMESLFDMGPFIGDDSGSMVVSSNNSLALRATAAKVNWALETYDLEELDTVDDGGLSAQYVRTAYKVASGVYQKDYWFLNPDGGNGKVYTDRWNDTTQNGAVTVSGSFTFTNGNAYVTASGDYTSYISEDDFIYLEADGNNYMTPITVSGVNYSGGTTTITLEDDYSGTGGSGNAVVDKALPRLDSGKYVKHVFFRVLDGAFIGIYGTQQFDTEQNAKDGPIPDYPSSVQMYDVRLAYLIGTPGQTTWENKIFDLRPIPFYREGGGGGGGSTATDHGTLTGLGDDDHTIYLKADGTRSVISKLSYVSHPSFVSDTEIVDKKYVDDELGSFTTNHGDLTNLGEDDHTQYTLANGNRDFSGVVGYDANKTFSSDTDIVSKKYVDDNIVTDHGGLSGLSDDDHNIYIKVDGSRDFTAKVAYSSHPTFTTNTELVDKKYVDDEISGLTTDHGELSGLDGDDHPQYHNDTRGDARYYTQSQVDTAISNHHAPSSTDHDDRYYTETETDGLLTTLSGALQANIDDIEIGELPACGVRRTTDFLFPSSWGDVTFDTTDIENYTDVLEHDDTDTERINIKESGLYYIEYKFQVLRSATNFSYARVIKNGSTLLDGSESEVRTYTNEIHELTGSFLVNLSANDYITLQAYENVTGSTTGTDDTKLLIIGLKGLRGEQGPSGADGQPGTGSTINIYNEGSIEASLVSNLNFTGNVTVTSGVSYTTVDVGAPQVVQCYSTNTTLNLNNATPVSIPWDSQDIIDTDTFTHSTTVNNSRVYVDVSGWYEVSYNVYYAGASNRSNVRGRIRKNGSTYVGRGTSVNYTRNSTNDSGSLSAGEFLLQLSSGDYIELMTDEQGDSDTINMTSGDNYIKLKLFRTT